jgi:4-aminobutyrate aminotransferase-like enzyme/Ser/Thr protein kinase RdoA (MazF antagonist)
MPASVAGHAPVRATTEDAVRLAAELYGLRAAAEPLPGEYDDNFHLTAGIAGRLVLKVMHPGRESPFVEVQCRALAHLEARAPSLALPHVVADSRGRPFSSVPVAGDEPRLVWMLTWVPGRPLALTKPRSNGLLLEDLGRFLGRLDAALADFSDPAAEREIHWDLARADWIRNHLGLIPEPSRRALLHDVLAAYDAEVAPALGSLRRSVVHGDANDHNVLVRVTRGAVPELAGLVDFGDMLRTVTVAEPAVAAAYALLEDADPLAAAARVVAGYHAEFPLREEEVRLLFPLIRTRLAVSVVTAARRRAAEPDDPYLAVSEAPAWAGLARLATIHPRLAHYVFRDACGMPPVPHAGRVVAWLRSNAASAAPVLEVDPRSAPSVVFDLSVGSTLLGGDPAALETPALAGTLWRRMRETGSRIGVGRYDEARSLYTTPAFAAGGRPTDAHRTVHLGLDLFVEPGTRVVAPLEGVVHRVANNAAPKDYGPLVILRHATGDGTPFYTLYGHLDLASVERLRAGQRIARGEAFAAVGAPPANGDWAPHLHLQIITDLLELDGDFPGVAFAGRRRVWTSLSPDPNAVAGIPEDRFPEPPRSREATLAARRAHVGPNVPISYRDPIQVVRGWMQYLYDETGRAFLDTYNNVPLVGHGHPRVVRAVQEQMALLNTNMRYLHENATRYAERLAERLPAPLGVCYFLNSGSVANELALRLARAHTGRKDVVALEAAYHGHTTTLIDVSQYKFDGPGGSGRAPWVHVAPLPDDYRGRYRRADPDAGRKYARHVEEIVAEAAAHGGVAAFIAESLPSVGGQIVFPPGYLAEAYRAVRVAGGVCIADEVQVGFGRLGTHFWGFETQGVVPDIVVLGKPIANGFPLAAVVTTPNIARSFDNGMAFFSTFGGNPVACAAALAVLDVLEEERLQARALQIGTHLLGSLRALMERHAVVGDVRGSGLFLGVELVRDRGTLEPAGEEAGYVVNRLRELGILTGTDGPYHNVLKIRPPLVFTAEDADALVAALDEVLGEDPVRGG